MQIIHIKHSWYNMMVWHACGWMKKLNHGLVCCYCTIFMVKSVVSFHILVSSSSQLTHDASIAHRKNSSVHCLYSSTLNCDTDIWCVWESGHWGHCFWTLSIQYNGTTSCLWTLSPSGIVIPEMPLISVDFVRLCIPPLFCVQWVIPPLVCLFRHQHVSRCLQSFLKLLGIEWKTRHNIMYLTARMFTKTIIIGA